MEDNIKAQLEQEDITPFHKALLQHCKNLVDMSRQHMGSFYNEWDRHDEVYRGIRQPDKKDKQARERGEPEKMVIPMTYAQVQTFVAFCFALYYQRERMFQLIGTGAEDHRPAKVGEALLQRDLTYNTFESRLYQFLLDIARFGLGVVKTGWVRETQKVRTTVQQEGFSLFGMQIGAGRTVEVEEIQTKFLGNKILNVSPYRFFPDVRLPICRFQEGEFVASEDEVSYIKLKQMEKDGDIAGVKWLKPMSKQDLENRGSSRLFKTDIADSTSTRMTGSKGVHVLTEVQVTLVPSEFEIDGVPMGEEDYPVKYNVWYINDQRVVKAEPLGYAHDQYTYDIAEFSPDMHRLINDGLAGSIDQLQSVISWFINSHITSVRKTIQNWLVVDPNGVEMKDIVDRKPVIRLKPNVSSMGIDRWIMQLPVNDVTKDHINDAKLLQDAIQVVTGINDNALGQFHQGRRSATEARNVNSATAARLKMVALLIFKNALEPLARKLLSNLRDGLDEQTIVRVVGMSDPSAPGEFLSVTKADLAGNYDFEIFDGTLPSEKHFQSQALEELLQSLFSNPEVIPMLGYDPRLLLKEVLELRGIRNPERFMLDPTRQQMLLLQQQAAQNANTGKNGQAPAGGIPGGDGGQPGVPLVAFPGAGSGA